MQVNIFHLNCHHCKAESAVQLKEKTTRNGTQAIVGKCKECKEQNTYKSILQANNLLA